LRKVVIVNSRPFVNTVLGKVSCESLGVALSHEHLVMNPGSAKYHDSVFDDPGKIVQELEEFKLAGGKTIVEMTPLNFGRDVIGCREISRATGIHVICATGFHKEEFIPSWVYTKSDDEIIALLLDEVDRGVSDTGIKPGVLKIGSSHGTITDVERRVIRIITEIHKSNSLPISTHCDKGTMALEQCRLFLEDGADPTRVILGHVDIPNDVGYLKRICSLGFNVGVDHVGRDLDTGDATKLNMIEGLIQGGFRDQIFLSGDMGKKSYLKSYGGRPGLGYIPTTFKRHLMERGVDGEDIDRILVKNPQRVFCVDK
jgi:predicted metal-dependent phosphotriesterase family hydrolase